MQQTERARDQFGGEARLTRRGFLGTATVGVAGLAGLGVIGGTGALAAPAARAAVQQAAAAARPGGKPLDVVIYLYDRMTALDAIGPYEVLRLAPGVRVRFVAKKAGLVRADSGLQMLNAEHGIADVASADVLLLPGGDPAAEMRDEAVLRWVRALHETTRWTTSVCVGSLILGAAGLLKGLEATTHWSAAEALPAFGATYSDKRFVRQGKVLTAAGVSAGIDMALSLVALERGEETARTVQLLIEYDPQPPFDSGAPGKSTPARTERARQMLRELYAPKSAEKG